MVLTEEGMNFLSNFQAHFNLWLIVQSVCFVKLVMTINCSEEIVRRAGGCG